MRAFKTDYQDSMDGLKEDDTLCKPKFKFSMETPFYAFKNNILVKSNKILLYNGFPFHYEIIGFMLEFCNKYNIEAVLVLNFMDHSWIDLYKSKYKFDILLSLPNDLDQYLFVLLLTDDDMSFPDNLITDNVVCIDLYYKNRREAIKHHIPIAPFKEECELYALPIFNYINYDDKIKHLNKRLRPIISFLGYSTVHTDISSLSIIENIHEFDIYIMSRNIPNKYFNMPNIFLFENILAMDLFKILSYSSYVCYIPNNSKGAKEQMNCYGLSGCIPISFTTGCKLIIPKEMNKFLKFNSIIEYSLDTKFRLNLTPSLLETFEERERLISLRDKSLFNLKHMA